MDLSDLAQDRYRSPELVDAVMNHRFPQIRRIYLVAADRLDSQDGPCSME
jgi:hypothetical protein